VTIAHMTAYMQETDMTSTHNAPRGRNPSPVVALRRVDTTVDSRVLQGGNVPAVDERRADRVCCPAPVMAATQRDEDKELSDEVSHILQAGQAWYIPDDSLGEMVSNRPASGPPPEAKEGDRLLRRIT